MNEFSKEIASVADRVIAALNSTEGPTAWELKLQIKIPLSHLYMALGQLAEAEKIRITPEGLTYRVHLLALPAKPEEPRAELAVAPEPEEIPNAEDHRSAGQTASKAVLGVEDVLGANAVSEQVLSSGKP